MNPRLLPRRVKANVDGSGSISFRSAGELSLAEDLQNRGIPWDYESESFKYTKEHTYTPDFRLTTKSGKKIWLEYKGSTPGWRAGTDRTKILTVLKDHPELDLRIIWHSKRFANAKIRKGSKTSNSEWAAKNGIQQAVSVVPSDWIEE